MLNNISSFNQALGLLAKVKDPATKQAINYLLTIMQTQIKILNADVANGITITPTGDVALGLASATDSGALSNTDWTTFNGKQDHSNELDAIAALSDAPGLMKKTGDGTYSMLEGTAENDFIVAGADFSWTVKSFATMQALITAGISSGAESNWRFA